MISNLQVIFITLLELMHRRIMYIKQETSLSKSYYRRFDIGILPQLEQKNRENCRFDERG